MDAVRRDSEGKDRAQLRAMLERELAQRGVSESPLWFERTLDHLRDTSAKRKPRQLAKWLVGAGKFGVKALKWHREGHPLPDLSTPAWLQPRGPRAAWPVSRQPQAKWTAVHLAETARGVAGSRI